MTTKPARYCTTCGEEEGTQWSRKDCTYADGPAQPETFTTSFEYGFTYLISEASGLAIGYCFEQADKTWFARAYRRNHDAQSFPTMDEALAWMEVRA